MKKYVLLLLVASFLVSCQDEGGGEGNGKGKKRGGGKGKGVLAPLPNSSKLSSKFFPPSYIGGMAEYTKYIKQNIILPDSVKLKGIKGTVSVCVTINEKGDMIKSEVVNSIKRCPECTKEAMRLINKIPKWSPPYIIEENGTKDLSTDKLIVTVDF